MRQLLLCGFLILTGCASVTAVRVKPDDYTTKGLRYYLPTPYLLVTKQVEISRTEQILAFADPFVQLQELCAGNCRDTPAVPVASEVPEQPKPAPAKPAGSASDAKRKEVAPQTSHSKTGEKSFGGATAIGQQSKEGEISTTDKPPAAVAKPDESADEGDEEEKEPTESSTDAIQLTWLPDPCREMALRTKNVLATLNTKITFTDGWKLTQINADADATAVAKEIIGLAGKVIDARKDVRVAALGGGETPGGTIPPGGTPDAEGLEVRETQAREVRPLFLRKTTVKYLKPGLYQVLEYSNDNCRSIPKLSKAFLGAISESVSYSRATEKP